ncbi:MAG: nitroreductase family protein [Bacteroidales bacterium]|nr:nitroreductase family protein [Bacteroidales bacterium]
MKRILLLSAAVLSALLVSSCGKKEAAAPSAGVDNETIRTIMSRKSVRSFTDQPIPAEYMETMLKAAMAAPTGSNIQPWHFVVLTDKSQYEKVFENNFNMRIFNSAAAVVVFCADTTVTRPPRNNPDGEPVTRPSGTWRDDLGACTENFLLAAESLGLGAVWTAGYPYSDRYASMKRELGIPDPILPYCAVAVGYPAGDEQPKDKWKPERIHYEKW